MDITYTTTRLLLLLPIILVAVAVLLISLFLEKRRRMPIVSRVIEEDQRGFREVSRYSRMDGDRSPSIQPLLNRINEIDGKIEIVRRQEISEEAKNIVIGELEEEKKRLREQIKKTLESSG